MGVIDISPSDSSTATGCASTSAAVRTEVENAVGDAINEFDVHQVIRAGDFQEILQGVTAHILTVMDEEHRTHLGDDGREFIEWRVRHLVGGCLYQYDVERTKPTRYLRSERILCKTAGGWACGTIQKTNEDDPNDRKGPKLPYVVRLDPDEAGQARSIAVPKDINEVCRTEVCFGQRADALFFTLCSLPARKRKSTLARRFTAGERVACAVEDSSDDYSVWAAGTVLDVDYSVADAAAALLPGRDWSGAAGLVPYRVELDDGATVLVHRDDHLLVRDLALQKPGVRQCDAGRCMSRLEVRHRGDYTFEAVDHSTRRARPCDPPEEDDFEHTCDENCPCVPGGCS